MNSGNLIQFVSSVQRFIVDGFKSHFTWTKMEINGGNSYDPDEIKESEKERGTME